MPGVLSSYNYQLGPRSAPVFFSFSFLQFRFCSDFLFSHVPSSPLHGPARHVTLPLRSCWLSPRIRAAATSGLIPGVPEAWSVSVASRLETPIVKEKEKPGAPAGSGAATLRTFPTSSKRVNQTKGERPRPVFPPLSLGGAGSPLLSSWAFLPVSAQAGSPHGSCLFGTGTFLRACIQAHRLRLEKFSLVCLENTSCKSPPRVGPLRDGPFPILPDLTALFSIDALPGLCARRGASAGRRLPECPPPPDTRACARSGALHTAAFTPVHKDDADDTLPGTCSRGARAESHASTAGQARGAPIAPVVEEEAEVQRAQVACSGRSAPEKPNRDEEPTLTFTCVPPGTPSRR